MFKYARFTMTQPITQLSQQKGSALIIALVFLLALTLIGTTAMQGTGQQERMAGNYWDRNLAFQAAEAALTVARRNVDGTLPSGNPIQPENQPVAWWNANSTVVPGYQNLAAPPRYVIQNLGFIGGTGGSVAFGATVFTRCQVTARADGGTVDAVVILEEIVDCI